MAENFESESTGKFGWLTVLQNLDNGEGGAGQQAFLCPGMATRFCNTTLVLGNLQARWNVT
jgi:hypothetical protein